VGIFWDTPFTIVEKSGAERSATGLEETWIGRFKEKYENDRSTKFKKIGGILNEYRCTGCDREV
jgi:hypothetical protein